MQTLSVKLKEKNNKNTRNSFSIIKYAKHLKVRENMRKCTINLPFRSSLPGSLFAFIIGTSNSNICFLYLL